MLDNPLRPHSQNQLEALALEMAQSSDVPGRFRQRLRELLSTTTVRTDDTSHLAKEVFDIDVSDNGSVVTAQFALDEDGAVFEPRDAGADLLQLECWLRDIVSVFKTMEIKSRNGIRHKDWIGHGRDQNGNKVAGWSVYVHRERTMLD